MMTKIAVFTSATLVILFLCYSFVYPQQEIATETFGDLVCVIIEREDGVRVMTCGPKNETRNSR